MELPQAKRINIDLSQRHPCGSCTACCHALAVDELEKGQWCDCKHLTDGGCAIYGSHPGSCQRYQCGYTLGLLGEDEQMRPDRAQVIISAQSELGKFTLSPLDGATRAGVMKIVEIAKKRFGKWARRAAIRNNPMLPDQALLAIEAMHAEFTMDRKLA